MTSLRLFGMDDELPDAARAAALSQWFTPQKLARRIAKWANVEFCHVLEPASGAGALYEALLVEGADVERLEIDPRYAPRHRCGDFLTWPIEDHDVVVMNPPYENGSDVAFMARALLFAPRVVALLRLNALTGLGRYEAVWGKTRITRIAFLVRRPRFESPLATGGAESDFVVVEYVRSDSRALGHTGPQTIEHWTEAWS